MPKISKASGPSYGVEDALAQQAMDPHAPIEDVRGAREAIAAGRDERTRDGQDPNAVAARDVAYAEQLRQAQARADDDTLSDDERTAAKREVEDLRAREDDKRGVQTETEQERTEREQVERDREAQTSGAETAKFPGVTGEARGTVTSPNKSTTPATKSAGKTNK